TFKVGGCARYFVEAQSIGGGQEAVALARYRQLALSVRGAGHHRVGGGEPWGKFVAHALMPQCGGVECLSGIPGSVGGTPVQNVGAYGQDVSETVESVEALDLKDNQVRELCREACGFAYRSSIFNTSERGRFIILRVTYALTAGGKTKISYPIQR